MNAQETLLMHKQVEDIGKKATGLMHVNWTTGSDPVIHRALTKIWDAAQTMHRRLSRPDVVTGYRNDAIAQAERVKELMMESGYDPDDSQLASIGYACDLAMAKIKIYQRMAAHAAQAELLAGAAEEAA